MLLNRVLIFRFVLTFVFQYFNKNKEPAINAGSFESIFSRNSNSRLRNNIHHCDIHRRRQNTFRDNEPA